MSISILYSNRYGVLDVATLEAFERERNLVIPIKYRIFLLQHNGGVPERACFTAPEDPFEENTTWVEREVACFFALHHNAWNDDTREGSDAFPLQAAWSDFTHEQPESHLIPIGRDWSGNYICVGYFGEESGRIFFYDHEYEGTTKIAGGFCEFLDGLRLCERHTE